MNESWFCKVRTRGEIPRAKMLFVGIGPEADVAKYLGSVAHASVQDIDFDPFRVNYLPIAGAAPQAPPTEQRFWAVSASGVGTQTVIWFQLLRTSVDAYGQTTVMVTHDPNAATIADRILFLADGRIVKTLAQSTQSEVLAALTEASAE